jgi:tetratricopeptide (TPR) repeat protein
MRRVLAIGVVVVCVTFVAGRVARGGDAQRTAPPAPLPNAPNPNLVFDDLPGPALEVVPHAPRAATPAIPAFELPVTEPGYRSPRELRVRGSQLLGTEVKVRGFVTWAYNCADSLAIANPHATRAQIEAAIRGDTALCERPTFLLGDAPETSPDAAISVAAPEPARGAAKPSNEVPALAAGNYVVVTGRWSVPTTPTGHPGDGVLVWSAVERTAQAAPVGAPETIAEQKEMEIELDRPAAPMRKFVDEPTINASIERMNACNQAVVARRYDAAIAECQAAITTWDGNHLAWYAMAGAHMARRDWRQAKAAIERAVTLRPDQAMYQLYHGIALYETAHDEARRPPVRKGAPPPRLDAARDALIAAVKLGPDLWRAHYYLGRVYRELDSSRRAAVQFNATIRTNPGYRFAYIALIELYRRWDYIDQALAVALLGATSLPAADAADLWFEVGIIHDARHADDQAIEAFSNAIAARPDDAGSKFERAQIYLRKGDVARARHDLEDVARSTDPRAGVTKQLANQLLAPIAARREGDPAPRLPSWECTRQSVGNTVECRRR